MINSTDIFAFLSKHGRMSKVNVNTTLYVYEPKQEYKIVLKRYDNSTYPVYFIHLHKKGTIVDSFSLDSLYDMDRLDDYLKKFSSLSELIDKRVKETNVELIENKAKENEIRKFLDN